MHAYYEHNVIETKKNLKRAKQFEKRYSELRQRAQEKTGLRPTGMMG
jgi:hypothetical protein